MQKVKEWKPWTPESDRRYTKQQIERARPECRRVLREFARWVELDRGLTLGSIELRVRSAKVFLDAITRGQTCRAAIRALRPRVVEDFFVRYGTTHAMPSRRSMQAGLRLFLGFCVEREWVLDSLRSAVPSLHTYRLSALPRSVSESDVRRLLRSLRTATPRDCAIVMLLVSYGVRRGQVAVLELSDVDWASRTITFREHKGGKTVEHSLTPAVAESLARYLRHHRPASECPQIFLRRCQPHLGLNPAAITALVRDRFSRLGVAAVPRGPHALRHAFASRLLAARQPIKAIADLLGHRTLESTSIYAKVDIGALRELAMDWPEVQS